MAMTISRTTSISSYSSRLVSIEVEGVCRQDILKRSNYTIQVPYAQLSSTIQSIIKMGGKVSKVSLNSNDASSSQE
ncbi:MAG: phycobilisome linker polypeptide [Xenococcaceae cyanobacterium]